MTGKTGLARQLGKHIYFRNSINFDKWENAGASARVRYMVFDDINWTDTAKSPRLCLAVPVNVIKDHVPHLSGHHCRYDYDLQKAIFSGQGTFEQCSAHAFNRTIVHGSARQPLRSLVSPAFPSVAMEVTVHRRPVIIVMNDQTAEEQDRLNRWREDPWIKDNVRFVSIPAPLF